MAAPAGVRRKPLRRHFERHAIGSALGQRLLLVRHVVVAELATSQLTLPSLGAEDSPVDRIHFGVRFAQERIVKQSELKGQQFGIIAIELGVGISVAGVMLAIYHAFAARGR